jgi:hypothetical protein
MVVKKPVPQTTITIDTAPLAWGTTLQFVCDLECKCKQNKRDKNYYTINESFIFNI